MNRLSRRQFIATGIASALAISCTRNAGNGQVSSPSPQKTPSRIVVLEWVYVEDLLALGIQPVGVADISGYKKFVDIQPKLAESVVDVGTRQEPSLEAIAKLEPDLILGLQLRHENIYDSLSAIAPTKLFNPYPPQAGPNQLEEMQQTFLAIADLVERLEAGEKVLQQMQQTFKAAQAQLGKADKVGSEFILGYFEETAPQLRLFTDNALSVQVLSEIGLQNAWEGKFDPFGFNGVWVEALPAVQQANFLYTSPNNNVYLQQMQNNPVWKGLEFVQENRVYSIGSDTWLLGGPLSAQVLVNKVVASLT